MDSYPVTAGVAGAICAAVLVSSSAADIINVPGDFDTIQEAIDAAVNGDEVVVAPDTYLELIDFLGKAITVRSTDPLDPAVVAATIIDGNGNGPVVRCGSGETAASILDGLTITGGAGFGANGGGMTVETLSHPTIRRCVFRANSRTDGAPGGAIFVSLQSTAVVSECVFERNSTLGAGLGGGALGLSPGSNMITVNDCVFRHNRCDGTGANGGAILAPFPASITVDGCTFDNNRAAGQGGAIRADSLSMITNCQFIGNAAGCGFSGGAIVCSGFPVTIDDSLFCRNFPDPFPAADCAPGANNVFDDSCPETLVNVPGDFPTLQEAIDGLGNGSTVLLAPGTYAGPFDFDGFSITVRGTGGSEVTILDGQGAGSTVTIDPCPGTSVHLESVTITGGNGADGGGIRVNGAGLILTDVFVTGNNATANGGGMYIAGGSADVSDSRFVSNTAGGTGGGLYATSASDTTVSDSSFCQNTLDQVAAEALITLEGLVFLSNNDPCGEVVTLGACCLGDTCITSRGSDCLAAGGVYQGDDTTCDAPSCPPACPWDFDDDGIVAVTDLLALLGNWGVCP